MWRASIVVLVACSAGAKPAAVATLAPAASPPPVAIGPKPGASEPKPGAIEPKPVPVPVDPVPFAPDPADDGTTKGAVAVPGDYVGDERGINFLDTTVTLDELPAIDPGWH